MSCPQGSRLVWHEELCPAPGIALGCASGFVPLTRDQGSQGEEPHLPEEESEEPRERWGLDCVAGTVSRVLVFLSGKWSGGRAEIGQRLQTDGLRIGASPCTVSWFFRCFSFFPNLKKNVEVVPNL